MDAPFVSGVAKVIVPADMDEFCPPPSDCAGGVSRVVPLIVITAPGAEHPSPVPMQVAD